MTDKDREFLRWRESKRRRGEAHGTFAQVRREKNSGDKQTIFIFI